MADTQSKPAVRVALSKDEMRATLCAPEGFTAGAITDDLCVSQLRAAEVLIDATTAARIVEFVGQCNRAPGVAHQKVVAEGAPARDGEDGLLHLAPEFDPAAAERRRIEDAAPGEEPVVVDHYSRSAFRVVGAGTVLGQLVAPTLGQDGRTVTGRTVAAKDGKAFDLQIDDSVEIREDGAIVAARPGALRIVGRTIAVLESLDIDGWVDFSIGNLSFPGDVNIAKGVRDCFVVDADGDITVRGPVEAASIRAGRDAILAGGMAGREKGSLLVQRDLKARYLGMVAGVIGRNLEVEKECVDCDLEVRGSVRSERCVFIGGRLAATASVVLAEVGGESGASTEIILGRSPAADRQLGRAGGLRTEIERRLERHGHEATALESNSSHLNSEQKDRLRFLRSEIGLLVPMRERLLDAADRLRTTIGETAVAELTVQRRIHSGVRIMLGNYEVQFRSGVNGPIQLTLNSTNRPIAIDPRTKKPRDITEIGTLRALRTGGPGATGRAA